jgi:hypothetical protein
VQPLKHDLDVLLVRMDRGLGQEPVLRLPTLVLSSGVALGRVSHSASASVEENVGLTLTILPAGVR